MPEPTLDVTGRPTALRDLDLDTFFHPKSVAVIGASDAGRRPNTAMWRKIRTWGENAGAAVYPVNPNKDEIDGVKCYPSIIDVPGDIDLAVILVGQAVEMFETVLEKKPKFAVIFAAGFDEVGAEGEALQKRLEDLIATGNTHLLGPNTNLNAFETFRDDLPAPKIALITQSGHQGRPDLPGPGPRHRASRTGRPPATRPTSSSPTSPATSSTSPTSAWSPPTSRASRTAAR